MSAHLSARGLRQLDRILEREVSDGRIPGCVLVVARGGRVVHECVVGMRDPASGDALRTDDLFRLASMTKPLTSVAALMLVERGDLQLFEPIETYLPELAGRVVGPDRTPVSRPPTVHDLFRHTSGFTYGVFGTSPIEDAYRAAGVLSPHQTSAELVRKLADLPLRYEPGTTFEYSVSTDLLGRIVEVVSGSTLGAFLSSELTGPLGMTQTTFTPDAEATARLALGFADRPEAAAVLRSLHDPQRPVTWHSGGGGILGTAPDYARFGAMLLAGGRLGGERVLARKTIAWMTSDHLPPGIAFGPFTPQIGDAAPLPAFGYGFGLGVNVRLGTGRSASPGSTGDFGWGGISGTLFWCDPVEDLVVVALSAAPDQRLRMRSLVKAGVYAALRERVRA